MLDPILAGNVCHLERLNDEKHSAAALVSQLTSGMSQKLTIARSTQSDP